MDRKLSTATDLRYAAIAPAIVGHGVVFAVFMSMAPADGPESFSPQPIEIVAYDPAVFAFERPAEIDLQAPPRPEQAGLSADLDPRLGQDDGGAIEQAAIAPDAPFEAFSGSDAAETLVPSAVSAPQDAAEVGRLGEGGDRLAAIRLALRYQACQRLTEKRDPTCPAEDALVAHLRVEALRDAPRLQRVRVVSTAPSNYLDNFVAPSERPYLNVFDPSGFGVTAQNWQVAFEFNPDFGFAPAAN
ncbi:MAG: hypothetical protein AAGA24_01075 [Pseudomonadota bacterium]